MKSFIPTDICRAVFRDGALDLALAAALFARSSFTWLGWTGPLPILAGTLCPLLLYWGIRYWVFTPRAGHARIKEWRSMMPLLVVGYLLVGISLALVFVFRGPIPPGSPLNRTPAEMFLGVLATALFTGWACLGLRRLGVYGLAALAALLLHMKGLPSFAALAMLALPPLFMGLWLMRRFLQEAQQAEAEQPSPEVH